MIYLYGSISLAFNSFIPSKKYPIPATKKNTIAYLYAGWIVFDLKSIRSVAIVINIDKTSVCMVFLFDDLKNQYFEGQSLFLHGVPTGQYL